MTEWIHEKDLTSYPMISMETINDAMDICVRRVEQNIPIFGDGFPGASSVDNFYKAGENLGWTTGFYTGQIWLSYENEKDQGKRDLLRETADRQVESFLKRIETHTDVDHHDMGFLYSPSCVASWKVAKNTNGRKAAILAADQLISRFQEKGQFIQAWGAMGAKDNYRFIIDCLLNLPLLYWASEETGDNKYRDIAERHIHTAMKYVIRDDDSCWHTVFMNPATGGFDHGATCQGYKDGSAWARGQAWGIYGTAMAYRYTHDEKYKEYFKRVTSYFLNHLPKDLISYWDLTFGDGDESEPRDSSSDVIAVCGMLEMSRYMDERDKAYYTDIAGKLLKAVNDRCFERDDSKTNGLLLHGTYSHKSPYNTCTPEGTDECVIWGDYYFMEALNRLKNPSWNIYW